MKFQNWLYYTIFGFQIFFETRLVLIRDRESIMVFGRKKDTSGPLSSARANVNLSRSASASTIVTSKSTLGKIIKRQNRMTGAKGFSSKSISSNSFLSLTTLPKEEVQAATLRRNSPWNISRSDSFKEHASTIDPDLSSEQARVIDSIMNKKLSVFFTGSAGTGKSYLLKKLIRKLYVRFGKDSVGVTAPTGLAANNIGGETIHRYLGIGLGNQSAGDLVNKIKGGRKYATWKKLQVLIIDEISMVDGNLFDKLNTVAKALKENGKPFGGIQVILCGDFLQLPPVAQDNSMSYCFTSPSWREVINENIILTKVFRQKGDQELINILNALRIGKIDRETEIKFQALSRNLKTKNGLVPTELYPTRNEVDRSNHIKLEELTSKEYRFLAIDQDDGVTFLSTNQLLESLMCSKELRLKVGAQVMHIKNDINNTSLVNGTLGVVEAFTTERVWNLFNKKFKDVSLQNLKILKMVYQLAEVAKQTNTRIVLPPRSSTDLNDVQAVNFAELCNAFSFHEEMLPVVKFTSADDVNILKLVKREEFKPDNAHTVYRLQLPIILAWAMSIHKSQGQTLQYVKVDLEKVFEKGQVYVALSRCVNSKGLQVVNFNRHKVAASSEVISFYNSLF